VQAFDFGAAFNFSVTGNNEHVRLDQKYRGAIATESVNHFGSYPVEWTIESHNFWLEVLNLGSFS